MKNLLELKNICFAYHKSPLCLKDVNLSINTGDKIMIFGDEDVGKTTFLKVASSFDDTYYGKILYKSRDIKDYKDEEKQFSLLLSEPVLLNSTLQKNIEFVYKSLNKETPSTGETMSLLKKFQINKNLKTKIKNLSLFEKRKLALVRTFIKKPTIIFLDDQFVGLDSNEIEEMKLIYKDLFTLDTTIFYVVSYNTYLLLHEFFDGLNVNNLIYLSLQKCYNYKTIIEFFNDKVDFGVIKYISNIKVVYGKVVFSNEEYFYLTEDENQIKFDKCFYDKLSNMKIQADTFEDVYLCFDKTMNLDRLKDDEFNKLLKTDKFWLYQSLDNSRII